ncbi:uncharacterized protein LOC126569295 [Anopheles aquasalis]|uniref:uncharacterized protein LOC126569295 n=1 Tax=Anopheles aquasalis TaxID=42839 RepID=UPI00215B43ED|nr:uncharacterized protein LOC126569295 [Anopheles aquasalis]
MTTDTLVPIPIEDLEELRDLYQHNWPHNEPTYNLIQNYIDWHRIDRKLKDFAIYSLNGTWRQNGTFVLEDRYLLFFYSLDDTNDTVRRALDLVDWDYSWQVSAYHDTHRAAMLEIIQKHNLQLIFDLPTETRYLRKEAALQFTIDVPAGTSLRPLSGEDAVKANALWPHRAKGSEFLLKRLALWNASVGLFDESTNEMLAWCFRLTPGPNGALEVPVEHRRKGYGTLVTKALAVKLAEMGCISYGFILKRNTASIDMFRKLGFENVGSMYWTRNVDRKLVEWDG